MSSCGSRVRTGPKQGKVTVTYMRKGGRRAKHGPNARLTHTPLLTPIWRPANTVKTLIMPKRQKAKPDGRA
jgi:hypothetical protein